MVDGQRIPCFGRIQLTITWMSNIKLNTGYRVPYYVQSVTFHIGCPVVWMDRQTEVVSWCCGRVQSPNDLIQKIQKTLKNTHTT